MPPADAYTVSSYADFLLDERRFDAVLKLAQRYPAYQDLALRRALAGRTFNTQASSHLSSRVREQFAAQRQRGDFVHQPRLRALPAGYRKRCTRARSRLALSNWRTQREAGDARIVLRAAIAARRPEAAGPVIAFIESHGVEDVRLTNEIAQLRKERRS